VIVLRALSALLTYPRRELLDALDELRTAIAGSRLIGNAQKSRLAELVAELGAAEPLELEERYVGWFERGRAGSLHLFEHVHGDSRERGQAMVDLIGVYERAGFRLAANELPDYLPAVLEYLSCRSLDEARDMLGDCAHILRALGERLVAARSRYAAVLDALLAIAEEPGLDWSKVSAPPESDPDEDWMDAPAFGPGSERNSGARPASAPIHFVPRKAR